MSDAERQPVLLRYYRRYLEDEESARFIKSVSEQYNLASLSRLAAFGNPVGRRASILALGLIGDYSMNAVLGRGMHDEDRGVRLLSENGIRDLWRRDGAEPHRLALSVIIRHNSAEEFDAAIERADWLIDEAPWFAEAWNQRAIAYFHLSRFEESVEDCRQTLELNPYHFAAAVGMAHCYLELGDAFAALECFRRALRLNPDMDGVRAQVEYLQRTLDA